MIYKIKYMLDNLRQIKVVGPTRDDTVAHLMFQSEDTLLLRYQSSVFHYSVWILVRRTSRQCYRVTSMITRFESNVVICKSFKTNDATCHWIKETIRRY